MADFELPSNQQIDQHLRTLADTIAFVPELDSVRSLISNETDHAREVYESYLLLIGRMATLSEVDMDRITLSQRIMQTAGGEQGSASKVGANDIVHALEDTTKLNDIAAQSVDPDSEFYQPALELLQLRLQGGSRMKVLRKTPSDNDPASHSVIWGHTVIEDHEALLHFTICHYLERFFAEALNAEGLELALQKDFLINALDDVVILDHLNNRGDETIYEMWSRPKDQDGLGWITPDRIESYS